MKKNISYDTSGAGAVLKSSITLSYDENFFSQPLICPVNPEEISLAMSEIATAIYVLCNAISTHCNAISGHCRHLDKSLHHSTKLHEHEIIHLRVLPDQTHGHQTIRPYQTDGVCDMQHDYTYWAANAVGTMPV